MDALFRPAAAVPAAGVGATGNGHAACAAAAAGSESLGALLGRLGLEKAAAQPAANDIDTVDDLRLLTEEDYKR